MNTEWLNTNRYRSYPFKEDSELQGLPNWCLVDFYLVDTITDDVIDDVFLVKAENNSGSIKLTLSYRNTQFSIDTTDDYAVHTVEIQYQPPAGQHKPVAHCVTGFGEGSISETIIFNNPPKILPTRIIRKPGGSGVSALCLVPQLPYDAEVEYLESTGTQYVDTGVIGGSVTRVRIVAASPNTSAYAALFGARQGSNNRPSFCIWQNTLISGGNGTRFDYNDPTNTSTIGTNAWMTNATNEIVKNGPRNYVNGVEVSANTTHSFALAYPFYLFNVDGGGAPSAYPFVGSVYECQIWDSDGALVRDFIPVRVGSGANAVGYLYDRANPDGGPLGNGLYGNAADGQGGKEGFPLECLGPDKDQQSTDASMHETSATGRIHLGTGCNCNLKIYDNLINIETGVGLGRGKCCGQPADDGCAQKLLFINGQTADSDGNITLSGGLGFTIYPGGLREIADPSTGALIRVPSVIIAPSNVLSLYAASLEPPIPTVINYVQDGLLSMWDGIENAGLNTHRDDITTWADVIGDNSIVLDGQYTVNEDNVTFTGGYGIADRHDFTGATGATISVLAKYDSTTEHNTQGWSYYGTNQYRLGAYYAGGRWYMPTMDSGAAGIEDTLSTTDIIKYDFVWDSVGNTTSIYKNGVLLGSVSQQVYLGPCVNNFRMMAYGSTTNTNQAVYSGTVFTTMVYSKALSAAEVAYNYSIDQVRFNL